MPNDGIAAILGDGAGRPSLWLATIGGGLSHRACMVWVELILADGVTLRVRDDGIGCDPATLPEMMRREHAGLRQMRERVEALAAR